MDCGVLTVNGDHWMKRIGGGCVAQIGGGFSHDSEHDLAAMVSDFVESNGNSGGSNNESWYSSDSDSGLSDLSHLANNILYKKLSLDQYENQLVLVVNSLIQSIKDMDLHFVKASPCNASCIRFVIVKLLRLSGYDAAVCSSKWQGSGKVPGGDHEYIDVISHKVNSGSERLIIDMDFRSHFEIARAVNSYDRILNSLPVVYVGSLTKLKQLLQIMVEAARSSLKQNSMPLPPWRSLAYLQAKWQSPYQRQFNPEIQLSGDNDVYAHDHNQCSRHLKRLQLLLQSEVEIERFLKPLNWRRNSPLMIPSRDAVEKYV